MTPAIESGHRPAGRTRWTASLSLRLHAVNALRSDLRFSELTQKLAGEGTPLQLTRRASIQRGGTRATRIVPGCQDLVMASKPPIAIMSPSVSSIHSLSVGISATAFTI